VQISPFKSLGEGKINRLRDFFGATGDRLVVDGGDLLRRVGVAVRGPFERVGWGLQRRLIWPVADRLPRPESGPRALGVGVLVVLAGLAGAAGLVVVASGGSGGSALTEAAAPTIRVVQAPPPAKKAPAAPTLHGAPPDFKHSGKDGHTAAKQPEAIPLETAEEPASSGSASAATGKIASSPSAQASVATGPVPIAVAREFADAFVVYETGGEAGDVRDAFGKTATPQLAHALLQRPPRLPANVKVPQAKVVNVVAGPSHGPVHSFSVSLLRVGVTSELRLAMEKAKGEGWRVSDVLG
jgi:hypothetical protein